MIIYLPTSVIAVAGDAILPDPALYRHSTGFIYAARFAATKAHHYGMHGFSGSTWSAIGLWRVQRNGQRSPNSKEVFPATMGCAFSRWFCADGRHPGRAGCWLAAARNKWRIVFIQRAGADRFSIPVSTAGAAHTVLSLTLGWLPPVSGRFDLLYGVKPVTGFAIVTHGFQIRRGVMKC